MEEIITCIHSDREREREGGREGGRGRGTENQLRKGKVVILKEAATLLSL